MPDDVSKLINERIHHLDYTNAFVGMKLGLQSGNMVSMLRRGQAKLPLERVQEVAKLLEVCPVALMKLCLQTYQPWVLQVLNGDRTGS
ncbi:hypothetical protein ACFOY8_13550 [Thalassospira xianhensis]|uniref:HTH cro/C1-type domain-containing protein n=1 Tax=Thalassospira xianhensis MCCC 1A02616 TaxID=1177929 RepID=A0A367UIE1_9PROT|nr:hypothetical protein [Thalassospira xianhensis]RCK07791.1 hypothetical protein TH5_01735 [Thalassospira xianhensis MCCC 1A02616]